MENNSTNILGNGISPQKHALIESHRESARRIALSIIRRWQCTFTEDEIASISDLALCEAARKFDEGKGAKFTTYLYYHIKNRLVDAIDNSVSAKRAINALKDAKSASSSPKLAVHDPDEEFIVPDPDFIEPSAIESPEKGMIREQRRLILHDAISHLEDKHRRLLEMVYFKQVHPGEIAETFGMSRSTLRRAVKKARMALYDELASSGALPAVNPKEK